MRWWIIRDPVRMSVDNDAVANIDLSDFPPELWMVEWREGRGETQPDANEPGANGLRRNFIDVTPWVHYFPRFMRALPYLTIDQAKKIQIDLINELYESKRQAPFHYPVAAGDYWWDASDGTMFGSTTAGLQNAIAKVNEIIARLNSAIPFLDDADEDLKADSNVYLRDAGNALISYLNVTVVGTPAVPPVLGGENNINGALREFSVMIDGAPVTVARPGIAAGAAMPQHGGVFGTITHAGYPWVPLTNVAVATTEWIPIGGTAPVPVTPAEQAAILQGIAERTNELNIVKNTKIAEVNALDDIDDVIDYDVLADWPEIPLPPGYDPSYFPATGSRSVSIYGTPSAGSEGIPEAPSDGVTYGRRNMLWNPALALDGDVLDGGNF